MLFKLQLLYFRLHLQGLFVFELRLGFDLLCELADFREQVVQIRIEKLVLLSVLLGLLLELFLTDLRQHQQRLYSFFNVQRRLRVGLLSFFGLCQLFLGVFDVFRGRLFDAGCAGQLLRLHIFECDLL